MEVEKHAEEFSKEELRRQLYTSLRCTGVLDSMKGQLRARLLEHLRHHNGDSIAPMKRQGKPSLTERLLNSLFLDYLESNEFTFTVSVFMPESQMASWPPFSYEEMLDLLHLDPSSDLHIRLKLYGEGRGCLAHQLVTVLQQMAQHNCIQEVSTQTSPNEACKQQGSRTSCSNPKEFEMSIKEVKNTYIRKQDAYEAQRLLPYRSLEDKITILHEEFDARVNAEVALQVSRIREYEINAARMDEAARYRRQLARDREELEDIHKVRMNRIKAREESLLERMSSKEKAIEASAYERRQKILTEITGLRERENKLRQFKESQEHREEKLDERELSLMAKDEEVARVRKTLYAQADDYTVLRRKELEEQYKELCDRLHHDRTHLEAEREQMKEEKVAMAIELAASRSDKELIHALYRRQSMEEDQRLNLVRTTRELEEKLKLQSLPAPASINIPDKRLEERLLDLQTDLEQERLLRQASEKKNKTLERKLQQKKVELTAARNPQGEWILEHRNLMATIHQQAAELQKETKLQLMETERKELSAMHRMLLLKVDQLDTVVKKAQEEKDRAICNLEILQVQHTTDERKLLETTMLLRKAQQGLEAERLEHYAQRSHMNAVVPSISVAPQRDRLSQDQYGQTYNLIDYKSSADEAFRKEWESFRKCKQKPKRELHDLRTQILSDNAVKRASLDQELERNPVDHFSTLKILKPSSSGFGYQLLELREDGILKGGINSVTKTESLVETAVNDSIEYYTSSWDQDRYGEYSCEDAIPSWRKTNLPEAARIASWINGYEESVTDVQSVVRNRHHNWSKVDMGVRNSSRDPRNTWNLGQYGDLSDRMRWNMAYFEGEEKTGERYDYQELVNGVRDFEMTADIHNASTLEINSSVANIRNFRNPDTSVERKTFSNSNSSNEEKKSRHLKSCSTMKGITTTEIIQSCTHTLENECQGRLSSSCTLDVCDDHEHKDLDLNQGKPFLTEKDLATSNNEEDQLQTSGYEFTTCTNVQTSMDISSVEDNSFKKDLRSLWDPEKHKMNSRTSLELTEDGVKHGGSRDLLTVRDISVVCNTKVHTEHVEKQGAEIPCIRENWKKAREIILKQKKTSQDSLSCKCISSLKHELETLEELTSSRDEMLVNDRCELRMDLHSNGDHHEAVDCATEVLKNPTTVPEIDDLQLLNSAQSLNSRNCEYMEFKEKIKDNQHYSRSEIDIKPFQEDKPRQATQGDEAHESLTLTNRVNELTMDITSLAPYMKQSEGTATTHSPTVSIGDSNVAQDPDKDLNRLMRSLGLTVATIDEPKKCLYEKEEEPLNEKGFSLSQVSSQKEESRRLVHENRVPASGKLRSLPEIGEMLLKQEMHAREKAQKNVKDHLLQDSTAEAQNPPEKTEATSNRDVNLESPQASKLPVFDMHALDTLRTSIVIRKQEAPFGNEIDNDTDKESPRLMDWMSSHKNHPTLALAIRNNQLVKLETQSEFEKEEKIISSPSQTHVEVTIHNKLVHDENSKETARLLDKGSNRHASEPTHILTSQKETHSSSEESIYKGDSFEEEEEDDENDQKPTYSDQSCTNEGTRVSSEVTPDSCRTEIDEQSSPGSKPKIEGIESRNLGRPPENWEGESEQGSYSPDEDDTVADLALWLDTCGSQETTNADRNHSISSKISTLVAFKERP